MPAHSLWLHRLPAILDTLRKTKGVTYLDRQAFENLFQVKARRARSLMNKFAGVRLGNVWAVDRVALIKALEKIQAGEEFQWDQNRRERVANILGTAKREHPARQVVITTERQDKWMTLDSLPSGVKLQSTELQIKFAGTQDLLTKLLQVSQALANDFDSFSSLIEKSEDEGLAANETTKTMAGGSGS